MIQLTDNLFVTADERNYIVGTARQRADRGIVMDSPSYFTTMSQAVRYAVSLALKERVANDQITTLRQFVEEQERLRAEFIKKLEPLEG
ncbi:Uncharacterised protein [uncultured Ruminococcus sp.]|nr:Uncharacterised protein [uncultured Clostridium sp.]SCI13209.1 Uncharacterised protein [uncultured Ruminococcus sp.]